MSVAIKKALDLEGLQNRLAPSLKTSALIVDGKSNAQLLEPHRSIVVTFEESPELLLARCLNSGVKHICQVDSGALESELNTAALMLKDPETFLKYPVSSVLAPAEASASKEAELTVLSASFNRVAEKPAHLGQLRQLLMSQQCSGSLLADVILIADEMYTNAVFNAPYIDLKTGYNPGIDRGDESITTGKEYPAQLMVGYTDERLVITCRDPFGTMSVPLLIERIYDCFVKGVSESMRMTGGGAGIGSYLVFSISSSTYVGVSKGKSTVVAASVHWKWNVRRRNAATKNMHYFEI